MLGANEYAYSKNFEPDPTLMKNALGGDLKAQLELGKSYYFDARDYDKAFYWYRKSAEKGYAPAQALYGAFLSPYTDTPRNTIITQNLADSNYWLLKAEAQGYEYAIVHLAMNYWQSSNPKAVYYLMKQAEMSDKQLSVEAEGKLGRIYYDGRYVPKDYKKAFYWYSRSAEKSYFNSEYMLGEMYYYGQGVSRDYEKAIYWYNKVAIKGLHFAQLKIAKMYELGQGVPKDYIRAYAWYTILSNRSNIGELIPVESRNRRANLESLMTQSQIDQAQALSSRWKMGKPLN